MSKQAHVIAVYSLKGGVGKTSRAVNLAAEAALQARGRTLLWDLDGQAASSFILGHDGPGKRAAEEVFDRDVAPAKLVTKTAVEGFDLLPADTSLRGLDAGKKKRLAKLLEDIGADYDRIILDCPPGAVRRKPLATHARRSKAGQAYAALWQRVAALLGPRKPG